MSESDISPGKPSQPRDEEFHYKAISTIEDVFSQKGIALCVAWAEARRDLDEAQFKALSARLKCSASARTKYVKGGEFFLGLSDGQKELLPDSATTLYAIASAPAELRDKAFAEGVPNKDLTRGNWQEWMRDNRVKRPTRKSLLQVYEPQDRSRLEALLERITQVAAENTAEVKVSATKKKRSTVREQIRAIAQAKPEMSVAELVKVLGFKDAA